MKWIRISALDIVSCIECFWYLYIPRL